MRGAPVGLPGEPPPRPSPAQRWVRALGTDTALWLAAVPQWSVPLAEAARLPLPPERSSVEELVRAISLAGVAAQRSEPSADGSDIELFWVPEATRRSWITELARQSGDLTRRVAEIAGRVGAVASRGGEFVPALTRQWLELLDSESGRSGDDLFHAIAGLVRTDDLAQAAALTDAAEAIAPVRGGGYRAAVLRGRRLVQAGHRRRRDREVLADFVPCDEQTGPLLELIRSDGAKDPWALHLLGPGGAGKTMLMRYLASDLFAADNGIRPFTVARVDFDHISEDYPVDRPVQLLTELADDIWTDTAVSDRPLRAFFASARAVNAAADSTLPLDESLVLETVERFAEYLNTLPAPQVLILDTCEELAKLHPAGTEAPAVTRTFELLEAVRERCPMVRAVFAGRRYLASSGADWTLPELIAQEAVVSLAARPYLRLVEVKGFSAADARTLLLRPHRVTGEVPPEDFVRAVLDRSPEVGGEARAPEPGRYNPFMLAHYRRWWEADPRLVPAVIARAGPDAYIAERIVARLQDRDIAGLLPAMILLGRFDEEMLAAAMDEPPDADGLDRVAEALAEQEWITLSLDAGAGLRVLALSPGLLPLLWEWVRRPEQRPRLVAARERLAGPLRDRMENASLSALTAELVIAALRGYPPGSAAVAWTRVEARVEREGRWEWAGNILRRARAELRPDLAGDPLLDAALTASALAAQWRSRPTADMSDSWRLVASLLERVERPLSSEAEAVRARLAARAELGRERARPATPDSVERLLLRLAYPQRGAAPLASVVAALEAVLAPLSAARRSGLGLRFSALSAALLIEPPEMEEIAVVVGGLVAVATLLPPPERAQTLEQAATYAGAAHWEPQPACADRPLFDRRDPLAWVTLHKAALALETGERVDLQVLVGWLAIAREVVRSVDRDRLIGCCIELSAVDHEVPEDLLKPVRYDPALRPTDAVHAQTPARFFAVARALLRSGRPSQAERLIEDWRKQAFDARADDAAVSEADAALAWLAIRMRWEGYRPTVMSALRGTPGVGAPLSAALGYLVDGEPGLDPRAIVTELTERGLRWLTDDIQYELRLVSDAISPDLTVPLYRTLLPGTRDPITACQLLTATALREARDYGAPTDDIMRRLRVCYSAIPAAARPPEWGSIGVSNTPDDPWYWWRLRWSLLDGSARGAHLAEAKSPELRATRPPDPGGLTPPMARRRWLAATAFACAGMAAYVSLAAYVGLLISDGATTPLSVAIGAIVVGPLLATVTSLTRPGMRLLRRLARPFVLAVNVSVQADPQRGIEVDQGYDAGDSARPLSWLVPVLPRRLGPAPGADGRRADPPLRASTLRLRSFDCVATVMDMRSSMELTDWEHELADVAAELTWRCVWVRDSGGPRPRWRNHGTVMLNAPPAWMVVLNQAYDRSLRRLINKDEWPVPPRIEHQVGLPVRSGHGVVLQVGYNEDLRGTGQDEYWEPSSGRSAANTGPLSRIGYRSRAWLTVIQVTPEGGHRSRDASMAELTRQLALDAQRETGNWVLALPELPYVVARKIWRTLDRFARRRRVGRRQLIRCVGEIKRLIVDNASEFADDPELAPPGVEFTARDVAQDVVLIGPWGRLETFVSDRPAGRG